MKKYLLLLACVMILSFGIANAATDQIGGLAVKNWKGEYIGSVKHVLTDSSSGNIIFVLLSLGQEESREIVVPVKSFSSYDSENGYLVLNVSKEILDSAPEFHASDLKDPQFVERVYRFFGLAPSWGDETKGDTGS